MSETDTDLIQSPSVDLLEYEIKASLVGLMDLFIRPIEQQPRKTGYTTVANYHTGAPEKGWSFYRRRSDGTWESHDRFDCPFGMEGTVLWGKEPYWYCCEGCKIAKYKADGVSLGPKESYVGGVKVVHVNNDWLDSATMPRWASRIIMKVARIEAKQFSSIDHDDVYDSGWHPSFPVNKQEWDALLDMKHFRIDWDEIYKERGLGVSFDPWCWIVHLQSVKVLKKG